MFYFFEWFWWWSAVIITFILFRCRCGIIIIIHFLLYLYFNMVILILLHFSILFLFYPFFLFCWLLSHLLLCFFLIFFLLLFTINLLFLLLIIFNRNFIFWFSGFDVIILDFFNWSSWMTPFEICWCFRKFFTSRWSHYWDRLISDLSQLLIPFCYKVLISVPQFNNRLFLNIFCEPLFHWPLKICICH